MEMAIELNPPMAETTPAAVPYKETRCSESIQDSQSPTPRGARLLHALTPAQGRSRSPTRRLLTTGRRETPVRSRSAPYCMSAQVSPHSRPQLAFVLARYVKDRIHR